ncbi:hypothetical protein DEO72_LG2g2781 [Vigna unguiculata]|uniref:t-SNARE coiled-coil homology domain-containing protein n=1 Tax=Vigna unguiculata TaxID=3917 RepID=A0A4D6L1R6_VIGUN|nr:hypothetical protein DEO72_LG2g2781 [Vigna unguiculata]
MLRSKGGDAPLPYGILITRIMQYSGVDLSVDASTTIGLRQQFSTNSLKKLNIVNVNGVWQHAHANEHDQDMQITMHGLEHMDGRMQQIEENVHRVEQNVHRMEENFSHLTIDMNRRFDEVNFNVNEILHKLDNIQHSSH